MHSYPNTTYAVGVSAFGRAVLFISNVCCFSARSAEKQHTEGWVITMLPQANSCLRAAA
jgi:hypothetical protein